MKTENGNNNNDTNDNYTGCVLKLPLQLRFSLP